MNRRSFISCIVALPFGGLVASKPVTEATGIPEYGSPYPYRRPDEAEPAIAAWIRTFPESPKPGDKVPMPENVRRRFRTSQAEPTGAAFTKWSVNWIVCWKPVEKSC